MAIKLMMHNEFITQRIPELTIRDAQLHFIQTNDSKVGAAIHGNFLSQSTEPEMEELNLPLKINDLEFFQTIVNKKKIKRSPNSLYITSPVEGDKLVNIEDCFLMKSFWRLELKDLLTVVKSYIWKISLSDNRFSDDSEWENLFIQPEVIDDEQILIDELTKSMALNTPENSPVKAREMKRNIMPLNAPMRVHRRPLPIGPMKIKRETRQRTKEENGGEDEELIESCSTIVIPYKERNIRYEIPELPRSIYYEQDGDTSSLIDNTRPTLVDYLRQHLANFKFIHFPFLHRPVFQRLGLHYLSIGDQMNAAYNFSMSINIAYRQLYQNECHTKVKLQDENSPRWNVAANTVSHCLASATNLHTILAEILPNNWTVLQFTMIDEIKIRTIKSSLLDGSEGGCLGARNVAVLIVTKYQNCSNVFTVESKVMHRFKSTGLQNMESIEKLKVENLNSINLRDRYQWWKKRREIDETLERLLIQIEKDWFSEADLNWMLDNDESHLKSEPKILITDRHLGRMPLESILANDQSIPRCFSRMQNLVTLIGHLTQIRFRKVTKYTVNLRRKNLEVQPQNAYFIVNPDNSLQCTEDVLCPLFKDKLKWDGVAGKSDDIKNLLNLQNAKDMTIYCGHGCGSRYIKDKSMVKQTSSSAMFLLGCYSARQMIEGRSEAIIPIALYLNNGCPSVLGLMWDVTDREIDKFTQKMFVSWLSSEKLFEPIESRTYRPVAPLSSYIHYKETSEGLNLKTLTGRSVVVYGLPIWVDATAPGPHLSI